MGKSFKLKSCVTSGLYTGIVLLCLVISFASISADEQITIRVGIYENQPKIFTDDTGKAQGFWPDLIEYIASTQGWKIEYVHGSWAECLQRLEAGKIDVMPDVAYSEERSRLYDFSQEPVYTSWSRVYARPGTSISSILDLEGKKVAVLKGSVNVDGIEGIKQYARSYNVNCTFLETDSYIRVFELVENGEADAGVTSKDFGYQNEMDFKVVKTPIIFQPSLLYFAFTKNAEQTPYLISKIDESVRKLKQDNNSIYYRSLDKWLAVKSSEKPVIPQWLIWVLAGIGGLAVCWQQEVLYCGSR